MAQSGTSKSVTLRGVTIGEGMPKICVPVMGHCEAEVLASADAARLCAPDVVEWRIDWLDNLSQKNVDAILGQLRRKFPTTPLLVTFRSQAEGGEGDLEQLSYVNLLSRIIVSGQADLVDVELFSGVMGELVEMAHHHGVAVIGSSHDFQQTPDEGEIVSRLEQMMALGCDIPKIAVMPQSPQDVLILLSATELTHEKHPDVPIITMSMGQMGTVSRLCGEVFGSALTFGSAGQASAPGQVAVKELREILKLLHG